jgi:hypothetical protein
LSRISGSLLQAQGRRCPQEQHMATKLSDDLELSSLNLERIVPLAEAARLRGVSEDTLRRHNSDKIIQLSPRRQGMRVRDALAIEKRKPPQTSASA